MNIAGKVVLVTGANRGFSKQFVVRHVLAGSGCIESVRGGALTDPSSTAGVRQLLDINAFGPLALTQVFAPVLKRNGGGAVVNILSVLSWAALPDAGANHVSKAAAWAMTNALREELRKDGTLVVAVHPGFIDTDDRAHHRAEGIDARRGDAGAGRDRTGYGRSARRRHRPRCEAIAVDGESGVSHRYCGLSEDVQPPVLGRFCMSSNPAVAACTSGGKSSISCT